MMHIHAKQTAPLKKRQTLHWFWGDDVRLPRGIFSVAKPMRAMQAQNGFRKPLPRPLPMRHWSGKRITW